MVAMDSVEILSQWLAAINSHDVKVLTGAADHVFVDSLGNRFVGASTHGGWLAELFPNVPGLPSSRRPRLR